MLKFKKIVSLMCGAMLLMTLCSTSVFAAEQDKTVNALASGKANKSYEIIVKGKENIEAYQKAGLVRVPGQIVGDDSLVQSGTISILGISIPTSTWNLNNGSRSFTYSISSYIYSNYKYVPYWDGSICQIITPSSNQNLKIQLYNASNNSLVSTQLNGYIDSETLFQRSGLDVAGSYYYKYTSNSGTWISGSGLVY